MNELLKAYIEKKQAELLKQQQREQQARQQKQSEQKTEFLIREGLYKKVYSDKRKYDAEFPETDWDSRRYYKVVPIEITDEEYEELKKYCAPKPEQKYEKPNIVVVVLTWMAGIVLIGGLILGIALGREEVSAKGYYSSHTTTEFSAALAFTYWIPALIGGISMLGFAEIIKLLEKIKTMTGELSEKIKNK